MKDVNVGCKSLEYTFSLAKKVDKGKLPLKQFKRYRDLLRQWELEEIRKKEEEEIGW